VYVTTSDKYLDVLKPFAYLFNKYWSKEIEVIVGGYNPPNFTLPSNFKFLTLGPQEDYPIGKWSDALIKMIKFLPDPFFVLMLEDYWITRPVDTVAVDMLFQYMQRNRNVIRMDLTADRKFAGGVEEYGRIGHLELLKSHPKSPYHMSLMCAMWRRELLLDILVPEETPWDIEIEGTNRLKEKHDLLVLGTNNVPVKHTLAFRGGDKEKLLLDELEPEDVEAMEGYGLLEGLK
jgi:hypothetical protein